MSVRTRWAALVAALAMAGCGGGSTAQTGADTPAAGTPAALVQLETGNFDALVLATGRPGVVEFHSPT